MPIGVGSLAGIMLGSSAIGAGGSIAGGMLGQAPDMPTTQKWQVALGALLQLPGFIGSIQNMRRARELSDKWAERTAPENYLTRNPPGQVITANTDVGLRKWLVGDSPYGGLLEGLK